MDRLILVALLGGIVALDYRASLRVVFTQPVLSALVTGAVLGDWREGFMAGALLQMMFLGFIPVRAGLLPDLPLGGVASAAVAVHFKELLAGDSSGFGLSLVISIAAGISVSLVAREVYRAWERKSHFLVEISREALEKGRLWIPDAVHFLSLVFHFAIGFALTAAVTILALFVSDAMVELTAWQGSLNLASLDKILPFIGAGALFMLQRTRIRMFFYLAGFACVLLVTKFAG